MDNKEDLLEQIMEKLDQDEVVELCQEMVRIPSENPPGRLEEITEFVGRFLRNNNLDYQVMEGHRGYPVLLARLTGNGERTLLLNGHLDVVPAGEKNRWAIPPFSGRIIDQYLHGRGSSDMKGGVAGLLGAFKAAAKLPALPGNVILILVPDEETGGHYGTQWLLEQGEISGDGCLIAEPSRDHPTIGQKGSCWLKLITHGKPGHGSLSPVAGDNAILKMNQAIQAVYRLWEQDWEMPEEIKDLIIASQEMIKQEQKIPGLERILDHVTVNVGVIRGGDKVNIIADYCEAEIDIRIPFGVEPEMVLGLVKQEIEKLGPGFAVESLRWLSKANYTLPEEKIVRSVVNSIKRVSGQDCRPLLQWASSDARHFRARGIPTIQYGPAELGGIHSYDEKVKVADLKLYSRVYATVIIDFLLS